MLQRFTAAGQAQRFAQGAPAAFTLGVPADPRTRLPTPAPTTSGGVPSGTCAPNGGLERGNGPADRSVGKQRKRRSSTSSSLDLIVINDRLIQRLLRKEIPILRYHAIAHTATRVRALTSLDPDEFSSVLPAFEAAFLERMREYTLDGLPRLNRRYTPYANSPLPTIEDKLLFILVHIKQNPTQEVQGQLFGMIQSDANTWLQVLRPVLADAVRRLDVLPARLASAMEPKTQTSDETPFFIMMGPNDRSNDR